MVRRTQRAVPRPRCLLRPHDRLRREPAVLAELEHLRGVFAGGASGGVFDPGATRCSPIGSGIAPGRMAFQRENAFSFGFAKDVYVAAMDDGETELFVTTAADATAASVLARRFEKGFLGTARAVPRPTGRG